MSESIPGRAGGILILAGLCFGALIASAAGADPAARACQGTEVATYRSKGAGFARIDSSCHEGSRLFLPWIDPGIGGADVREPEVSSSVTTFEEATLFSGCGVLNLSELTSFNPWFELPGDRKDRSQGGSH